MASGWGRHVSEETRKFRDVHVSSQLACVRAIMTIMALACENSHLLSLLAVWDISLEGLLAKSPSIEERVVSSHCQVVVSVSILFKTSRVVLEGTAQRKVCWGGGRRAGPCSVATFSVTVHSGSPPFNKMFKFATSPPPVHLIWLADVTVLLQVSNYTVRWRQNND